MSRNNPQRPCSLQNLLKEELQYNHHHQLVSHSKSAVCCINLLINKIINTVQYMHIHCIQQSWGVRFITCMPSLPCITCVHVYMYVYTCTYIHVYTYTLHVYMYTCVYIHVYVQYRSRASLYTRGLSTRVNSRVRRGTRACPMRHACARYNKCGGEPTHARVLASTRHGCIKGAGVEFAWIEAKDD